MTRYSLSRRIKLSHQLLLFWVDHIAPLFGVNRLAKCKRSASNLLFKPFYQSNISIRRDFLAKRLTLTSFGRVDGTTVPQIKKTKVGVNVSEVCRRPARSAD